MAIDFGFRGSELLSTLFMLRQVLFRAEVVYI